MHAEMSLVEAIERRHSCRSFAGTPLTGEKRAALLAFIAALEQPPFGTAVRFHLSDNPVQRRVPGTYGVIRGAASMLVGCVHKAPRAMEDFGFLFESVVLRATALGLGTCWLGGTFSRSSYARQAALQPDELLPAVSPVGPPAPRPTTLDKLFRRGAGSHKRLPFESLFFEQGFHTPLTPQRAAEYETPLRMVRLAPSANNKQPWRIVHTPQGLHFFLQRNALYDKAFGAIDLQRVDIGIAMCHFTLVARELGLAGSWQVRDDHGQSDLPARTTYIASWSANK